METLEKDSINLELYSKGIQAADYFVFREQGKWENIRWKKGKMQKFIRLTTTNGIISIRDIKARRQFLNHLGLGLREMENIETPEERNSILRKAIQDRTFAELAQQKQPLVFRCHESGETSYTAWSIVTSDYVEVPSNEALTYFEEVLQKAGYGDSKKAEQYDNGKAVFTTYHLWESPTKPVQVGDLATCNVTLRAGYSGDRSVGLIGGYIVLACLNGMMRNQQVMAYRGIHKGVSKQEILSQLEGAFNVVLAELPMLENMVEEAKEPLDEEEEKEMLTKILSKYPDHLKKQIEEALKKYAETEGTYKISQALSDTATHYDNISMNYKTELQQEAFKVLTIPRKKKKKVEENQ